MIEWAVAGICIFAFLIWIGVIDRLGDKGFFAAVAAAGPIVWALIAVIMIANTIG